MDWLIGEKFFTALFAIMNPLTVLPIFLAMTAGQKPEVNRHTLVAMLATVAIGAVVCAVAGTALLGLFGIDIVHFRLAGGLIVLLIGLSMVSGTEHPAHGGTPAEQRSFAEAASTGVYPLAIPIALGPGTMATIIIFSQEAAEARAWIPLGAGLTAYLLFFSVAMAAAPFIARIASPMVLSITRRLMGMILAAIAAEMIGDALGSMFPGLMH